MVLRSTIIASAAMAIMAVMTSSPVAEAHSWADCVDWRFNDPNQEDWSEKGGKCFGYARQFPVKSQWAFGDLDHASPGRHYRQDPSNFIPCSDGVHGVEVGSIEVRQDPISKAYGGNFGNMASVRAGDKMCIRWPAKNHAGSNEDDTKVEINMPPTPTNKDPSQSEFTRMNIAKLSYKNCNFTSDSDHTPCGGCFTVPADRQPGTYVVQWRWELNPGEWYTSCWDLAVTGNSTIDNGLGSGSLGNSTSLFAKLAQA